MKTVFADTLYWVAIVHPHDQWHDAAERARSLLGNVRLLTTDEVLAELLTLLSKYGENVRRQAARMARAILDNPNVKVIPQSRDSFIRGVELYEKRLDKQYSLTDCISMNVMKSESITDVLTNDEHFVQESFNVLITKEHEST